MRACPARVALVVEDEWIVRNNIVNELRESGWTVVETATGEEALVLLADREVDVVLTDIQLAGAMTGWDVARAARGGQAQLARYLCLCQRIRSPEARRRKLVFRQAL